MKRSKYTDRQVYECALAFLIHGSREKASEQTGIPLPTIADWVTGRKSAERWQEQLDKASTEAQADIQATRQSIIRESGKQMKERMTKGDPIVKDGEVVGYKPVSLRDIAWVHGVITDKQRVADGKATSISAKSDEQLKDLAKVFDDIANKTQDSIDKLDKSAKENKGKELDVLPITHSTATIKKEQLKH